jgi:subtilisin family serine protease
LRGATGLAVAALLVLMPVVASAKNGHGNGHSSNNSSKNNDDPGPGVSAGGGGNDNNPGSGASAGGNGSGARGSGGSESNPFNPGPGGDQPRVGIGFSNNGASVGASIPIGGPAHSASRGTDQPSHPKVTLPFSAFSGGNKGGGGPTRALAYGNSGGGAGGGVGGGQTPELTHRLIGSVANTFSNRFTSQLGNSLKSHVGDNATLANRSPATIVNDRFAGFGVNAVEPRVFTIPMFGETRYMPNEIVVGASPGVSPQQMAAIARRNGLAPADNGVLAASGLSLQRWRIADGRPVDQVIRSLRGETDVQTAQPNYRFRLAQAAGVSQTAVDGFSAQYAPAKLHLPQAHHLSTGQGVLVGVIDTGIDRLHPEIAGAIAGTFDAIGAREPADAHGTAIAGAIIAHGRLVGAAPAARILAIRAFTTAGPDAEATTMTVVRSIEYAIAQGARVINMSFAGARDPVIGRSLAQARRKGIVLVAAAGNAGADSPPLYPAADPNVIAVSATDVDDRLLDVANRGRQIALAAPGVDVLLPAPGGRYQIATGTSFAAAHVAGIAALMLAKSPQLSPEQVRTILTGTARDLGPKGRDDQFGAGLADALKAVTAAVNSGGPTVASAAPSVP